MPARAATSGRRQFADKWAASAGGSNQPNPETFLHLHGSGLPLTTCDRQSNFAAVQPVT